MRKRLERLEYRISPNVQRILVLTHDTDTETVQEKINRWKAGEEVEGIRADPYQGGEVEHMVVRFVSTKR